MTRHDTINLKSPRNYETFIAGETIDLVVPNPKAIQQDGWHRWFNDPHVTRFLDHGYYPNTKEKQKEYLDGLVNQKDMSRLALLIVPKNTNLAVGVASLSAINFIHRSAETAIVIGRRNPSKHSLFLALEAKARLVEHAFEKLGLLRIGGGQSEHLALWQSTQLIFGFRPEGLRRSAFRVGYRAYDIVLSGCTLRDYLRVKRSRGGNYWPGHSKLWEMIYELPRESIVDRLRASLHEASSPYLKILGN